MTIGSLFSGIGGLELGLERATGARVVWQVEADPYRRDVLDRHWPGVSRYDDVRHVRGPLDDNPGVPGMSGGVGGEPATWLPGPGDASAGCGSVVGRDGDGGDLGGGDRDGERGFAGCDDPDGGRGTGGRRVLPRVDLLCGGFPCTDLSVAAEARSIKGRPGLEGEASGLWSEFARIVGETDPAWVVVENVYTGWRGWLPVVRRDLWARGYASVPVHLRASDVGLPHARRRVFVLAYAVETGLERHVERELANLESHARHVAGRFGGSAQPPGRNDVLGRSVLRCGADGFSRWMDAPGLAALGDAVVPACAEAIGRIIAAAVSGPRGIS